MNRLSVWTTVALGSLIAASSAFAVVPLGTRLGQPLPQQLPGSEFGLIAIAAAGVIGGILIARRKR